MLKSRKILMFSICERECEDENLHVQRKEKFMWQQDKVGKVK